MPRRCRITEPELVEERYEDGHAVIDMPACQELLDRPPAESERQTWRALRRCREKERGGSGTAARVHERLRLPDAEISLSNAVPWPPFARTPVEAGGVNKGERGDRPVSCRHGQDARLLQLASREEVLCQASRVDDPARLEHARNRAVTPGERIRRQGGNHPLADLIVVRLDRRRIDPHDPQQTLPVQSRDEGASGLTDPGSVQHDAAVDGTSSDGDHLEHGTRPIRQLLHAVAEDVSQPDDVMRGIEVGELRDEEWGAFGLGHERLDVDLGYGRHGPSQGEPRIVV